MVVQQRAGGALCVAEIRALVSSESGAPVET